VALMPALHLASGSATALFSLVVLAGLLLAATVSDLRWRRISNRLCLAVALFAMPYWLATDPTFLRLAVQILCAVLVGMVLIVPFGLGLLGGGDVKLMAALALWIAPDLLTQAILMVAMGGGVLAVGVILFNRRSIAPTVPYGVAIAVAGLFQVVTRIELLIG
jgi:prepilin peptidase CpaA